MLTQTCKVSQLRSGVCRQARPCKPFRRPLIAGLLAGVAAGPVQALPCRLCRTHVVASISVQASLCGCLQARQASASIQAFSQAPHCWLVGRPQRRPPCRHFRAGLAARTLLQASPCRHLRACACRQAHPCKPLSQAPRCRFALRRPLRAGPLAHVVASISVQAPLCGCLQASASIQAFSQAPHYWLVGRPQRRPP